jgi:hypothetical protein
MSKLWPFHGQICYNIANARSGTTFIPKDKSNWEVFVPWFVNSGRMPAGDEELKAAIGTEQHADFGSIYTCFISTPATSSR